jgi:DNA-binding response OmpR family regulator
MRLESAEPWSVSHEVGARSADEQVGWPAKIPQVLLIDSDPRRRDILGKLLRSRGFQIAVAFDGALGVAAATVPDLDMVLLEVSAAGNAGLETLRCIRSKSSVPVIVVGGKGLNDDCAASLETGADDYVVRPYSERELLARLNAALRRHRRASVAPPKSLAAGKLRLVLATREVTVDNKHLQLTVCEFDLLTALVKSGKSVATKDDLYMFVLGRKRVPFDRTIDNHVSHLRKKLHDVSESVVDIETIRGIGYRLAVQV